MTLPLSSETSLPAGKTQSTYGIEFIDENGGSPGVRLRKRQQKKG